MPTVTVFLYIETRFEGLNRR